VDDRDDMQSIHLQIYKYKIAVLQAFVVSLSSVIAHASPYYLPALATAAVAATVPETS
jgi:fructose-specific component phosphotransferase system IIB-like protein